MGKTTKWLPVECGELEAHRSGETFAGEAERWDDVVARSADERQLVIGQVDVVVVLHAQKVVSLAGIHHSMQSLANDRSLPFTFNPFHCKFTYRSAPTFPSSSVITLKSLNQLTNIGDKSTTISWNEYVQLVVM